MKNKIIIILILIFIIGCSSVPDKFRKGDCVIAKINKAQGMIIRVTVGEYDYVVRFGSSNIITNSKLVGRDGPTSVSPISEVYMYEFELEACPK